MTVMCSRSCNWVTESGRCFALREAQIPLGSLGGLLAFGRWGSMTSLRWRRGTGGLLVVIGGKSAGRSWRQATRIPRIPVLDGYLISEMVPAFLLALGVGTTLGLSLGALVGLVRQVVASGLPFGVAVSAAMLHVPVFVSQTLPLACMAASLFGLGRLKADNEIVGLLAAGVPPWRMLVAPILLSGAAALLKVACNDILVPLGSSRARKMVEAAITTNMQNLRQTQDIVYPEYGLTGRSCAGKVNVSATQAGDKDPASFKSETVLQRIWYAQMMKGGRMSGLVLLEISPSGQVERVVLAESCEWNQPEKMWKFMKSTVLPVSQHALTRLILQVDCLEVPSAGLAPEKSRSSSSPHEFSRSQFLDHIALLEAKSRSRSSGIWESAKGVNSGVLSRLGAAWKMEVEIIPQDQAAVIRAKCLLFQRDASAFSCIIYGLVGATSTLALSTSSVASKSRAMPFAIALMGSLAYNGFAALSGAAGFAGILPPTVSAWLPIPFGIFLGLFMLRLMK